MDYPMSEPERILVITNANLHRSGAHLKSQMPQYVWFQAGIKKKQWSSSPHCISKWQYTTSIVESLPTRTHNDVPELKGGNKDHCSSQEGTHTVNLPENHVWCAHALHIKEKANIAYWFNREDTYPRKWSLHAQAYKITQRFKIVSVHYFALRAKRKKWVQFL